MRVHGSSCISFDRRRCPRRCSSRLGGGEDRVDLVGAAEADDRAVDGRVAQRPGDRDRAGRRVRAARRPLCSRSTSVEVAGELRLAGSARRACASRRRAGARSARGSSPRSAAPSPSASRRSRRSLRARRTAASRRSASRSISEYCGWSVSTGAIGWIRRSCSTSKFETPMWRTSPCSLSSAIAAQPSSMSSSGIGQWIW